MVRHDDQRSLERMASVDHAVHTAAAENETSLSPL